ncbi:hypothetical protein I3760_15G102200 [Carya illinoinensis]|nr:hypothetical protein I3760_15G102200 [Carya illinoinensis]
MVEIFSFDPKTTSLSSSPLTTYVLEQVDGNLVSIVVHPSGEDIVCSTTMGGCKLFEFYGEESDARLLAKELSPLQDVGPQECIAFSVDGSRIATGGVSLSSAFYKNARDHQEDETKARLEGTWKCLAELAAEKVMKLLRLFLGYTTSLHAFIG